MKIFAIFALSTSLAKAQETFPPCPANITGATSCQQACGEFSVDFLILANPFRTGDDSAYNYNGFNCECAEADPPVQCTYTYDFPACQDVGVADCNNPPTTCSEYCGSLGFNTEDGVFCERNEAVNPSWTSCICAAPFLQEDGVTPGTEMYVCGDQGYQEGASATAVFMPFAMMLSIAVTAATFIM